MDATPPTGLSRRALLKLSGTAALALAATGVVPRPALAAITRHATTGDAVIALAPSPDGLWALGHQGAGTVLWRVAADGTLDSTTPAPELDPIEVADLVETPDGLLAIGTEVRTRTTGEATLEDGSTVATTHTDLIPAAFVADGGSWQRIDVQGLDRGTLDVAASADAEVMVVGARADADGAAPSTPVVLVTDGPTTLRAVDARGDGAWDTARPTALAHDGSAWLLATHAAAGALVWRSDDGRSWTASTAPGELGVVTGIDAAGSQLSAVGGAVASGAPRITTGSGVAAQEVPGYSDDDRLNAVAQHPDGGLVAAGSAGGGAQTQEVGR